MAIRVLMIAKDQMNNGQSKLLTHLLILSATAEKGCVADSQVVKSSFSPFLLDHNRLSILSRSNKTERVITSKSALALANQLAFAGHNLQTTSKALTDVNKIQGKAGTAT
jgi:hypothetical protein